MDKKILRFLAGSVCTIIVFCVIVFVVMINHMHSTNEDSIRDVCQLYMSEMSHQIEDQFQAVAELRLAMVQSVIKHYPPEEVEKFGQEMRDELTFAAQIRNYEFAALYSDTGDMNVLYGSPVSIIGEEAFLESLQSGQGSLTSGVTESGDVMLLYGLNAAYPMQDGEKSLALLMGLPVDYIQYIMFSDTDSSLVYSHIIRKDGSFVLRNLNNQSENYYDWLLSEGVYDGQTPEDTLEELKTAMEREEDYSIIVSVDGQRRNIYCEPLDGTDWILVTVMLHGRLDTALSDLGNRHLRAAIVSCGLILLALLGLFAMYFRMSLRQMRKLEEAQRKAERASKAKSEFLSNMSHDIRTPMNAIVGMTTIALSSQDKPDMMENCLNKIMLSSKHLLGLINDVLDMSKIESGKLTLNEQEISLRDTFENIVSIISPQIKEKEQNFDIFIYDIQAEEVMCDDVRLNQVLINLLSNAVKFTPEGGSVAVTLRQMESPRGEKYIRTRISVKDTGIGMSEEFQKTIFDSFSREDSERVSHTEGTGLGMAITKYIVDMMQGTIEVKSVQGRGSEFIVTLDLVRAQIPEREMILQGQEMLVVDDDEQMCRSAVENLRELGVSADWATSGEEAIDMAQKHHEGKKDYHAVLLDLKMPGMDGIETARKMREQIGKDVPILMISAYDWSDVEEDARAAGISGFISKPLFKSTLYHGLLTFVDGADAPLDGHPEQDENEVEEDRIIRLLVAEDYDMNWEILETLLPDYGYLLDRAENGQVCVDKFMGSEVGYYAGILMDLRMPIMNGYEAAEMIRASERSDSQIPIIAMTADAFSDDIQRCLACGMNAHVAKPIDMRELLNEIKKYV